MSRIITSCVDCSLKKNLKLSCKNRTEQTIIIQNLANCFPFNTHSTRQHFSNLMLCYCMLKTNLERLRSIQRADNFCTFCFAFQLDARVIRNIIYSYSNVNIPCIRSDQNIYIIKKLHNIC